MTALAEHTNPAIRSVAKFDIGTFGCEKEIIRELLRRGCMDEGGVAHHILESGQFLSKGSFHRLKETSLSEMGIGLRNFQIEERLEALGARRCHPFTAPHLCLEPLNAFPDRRVPRRFFMESVVYPGDSAAYLFEIHWTDGNPRLRGVRARPEDSPHHYDCQLVFRV